MLETLACSAVLMLLYGVLFDRRVSFAFCRAYIPVSVVAAAVIPLLRIPVWSAGVDCLSSGGAAALVARESASVDHCRNRGVHDSGTEGFPLIFSRKGGKSRFPEERIGSRWET